MKIKKRWIILMTAMTLIAVAGLCVGEPTFDCDWSVISAADVAWLITATIFVLMIVCLYRADVLSALSGRRLSPVIAGAGNRAGNLAGIRKTPCGHTQNTLRAYAK
jgi:hypothetical protein